MKKSTVVACFVVAALVGVAAGAAGGGSTPASGTDAAPGSADSPSGVGAPTSEGIVYAGEYRNSLLDPVTGMWLFWQNDATVLYVGIVSPGTGWLAAGFSDRVGKPGSNILIGAIANGTVTIQDNYGVTKKLHLADKTSSVVAFGGSEEAGTSTLEFAIPMASGDAQDVTLVPGQRVQVILAYQATLDSFLAEHTRYSMLEIVLDA